MKIKNTNLEYWVFYLDINTGKPNRVNILKGLAEEIAKRIRSKSDYYHIENRDDLKKFLKVNFMSHYWGKCEMEYAVIDIFDIMSNNVTLEGVRERATKLDVWYQIELNLDIITDYIINKMDLKFNKEN